MKIPLDHMTCWELQALVYRRGNAMLDNNKVGEHSFASRDILLDLIAKMDEAASRLKDIHEWELEGPDAPRPEWME